MSKLMARDSIVSSSAREYTDVARRGNSANQAGARMAQSYFGPNIAITTTVRHWSQTVILAQIRRMAVLGRNADTQTELTATLIHTGRTKTLDCRFPNRRKGPVDRSILQSSFLRRVEPMPVRSMPKTATVPRSGTNIALGPIVDPTKPFHRSYAIAGEAPSKGPPLEFQVRRLPIRS